MNEQNILARSSALWLFRLAAIYEFGITTAIGLTNWKPDKPTHVHTRIAINQKQDFKIFKVAKQKQWFSRHIFRRRLDLLTV